METEIQKNIPIPSKRKSSEGVAHLLRKMEIGDSFYINGDDCNSAYQASIRLGISITRRKEGTGLRIWRTA